MAGYSSPDKTYLHAIKHGFNIKQLFDLPHDLRGEHQAAVNRLHQDGIIRKVGWNNRSRRTIWGQGPTWPVFRVGVRGEGRYERN